VIFSTKHKATAFTHTMYFSRIWWNAVASRPTAGQLVRGLSDRLSVG